MNILLTSVGQRSYVVDYFKEAVGNGGKVIATNSAYTHTLSYADKSYISPLIYNEDYIPFIIDVCKREKIDAILSLFDIDLPVLAKHQKAFAEVGARYIGPSYEAAVMSNDKLKTFDFFKASGLKTPRTYCNTEEVLDLLNEQMLEFPLVIKPRWGMGSMGVYIARNTEEFTVFYKRCRHEIENSYLNYESEIDIDKSVIIQEFIKGQEYGLDIYKDLSGNFVSTITKKRILMRYGETYIAEVVGNQEFQAFAETVAKNLDFTGILDVDCFISEGSVYGIEINARVSGNYPFSHIAGVDYPKQLIQWLNGEKTEPKLLSAKLGVRGCKELTPTVMLSE